MGYRREHQVEHRGEFAVRGGIVDVFPSTADVPVRIDLWGDEVDRLTAFSVSDQRSSHDLRAVALYGCRELVVTPALRDAAARARGAATLGRVGVGAPGRGRAVRRHGVVAPVPRRHGARPARPAAGRERRSCWWSRAGSGTAASSCSTRRPRWPRRWRRPGGRRRAEEESFPRLHVPFERLLQRERRPASPRCRPCPRAPTTAALTVRRFDPVAGDPARLAAGVTGLVGQGYAVTLCAATRAGGGAALRGPGRRGRARAGARRRRPARRGPAWWRRRSPAGSSCPTPRSRCSPRPTSPAGGSRTAGPARGRGPPTASSTTSRPGASSSTASTAWRASRA